MLRFLGTFAHLPRFCNISPSPRPSNVEIDTKVIWSTISIPLWSAVKKRTQRPFSIRMRVVETKSDPPMNQDWFEMQQVRQRKFDTTVWIPLRASRSTSSGESGRLGYKDEFFGAASIAVPVNQKTQAETLDWSTVGLSLSHCGYVEGDRYKPADVFEGYRQDLNAVALALEQDGNSDELAEWHLHQDLAITLKLKREGDKWLAMNEAYIEVARLIRDEEGGPKLLEIRAEFLKDYLCARGMALFISSYRSRIEIVADAAHINWTEDPFSQSFRRRSMGGTPNGNR